MTHSPTALASHLACTHLTQLERLRRTGKLQIEFRADPRVKGLQERGLQHEQKYIERLKAAGRSVHDLRESRDPSATLDALRAGHGAIVQAPLGGNGFFGIADVLLRVESPSRLGPFSYEPVDTKLARETRASTILQLATYCELMKEALGDLPEHFHVVTPLGEETYRTADFGAYFRFVRRGFEAAHGAEPPPATYPDPVEHCDICKYWLHCDERRRKDDHPSLIAGIGQRHVREFQAQALPTVSAIAQVGGVLGTRPKRGRAETYAGLGHQARLQVAARAAPLPPYERLDAAPGQGFARLPEPSPGDIFLDFEGDPFAGESGLEYLTGWHVRESGPPTIGAIAPSGVTTAAGATLQQIWALGAREEKPAFERFIDFALERWERHPGLHIYHFGAYEPATLKRLAARHETRGEQLDRLLRAERFIDLHRVVREAMRIGIERYGLKELEPLHGFPRAQDLREAAAARRDVELALELGDRAALTDALRDQVARYNAEDCYSTEALRTWLEARRSEAIASGMAIERPPIKEAAPTEAVGERDQRIQALKAALGARLPEDPAAWSGEHRATHLLASMLGYFRQEQKNAYWEHFRLRDLPADERMDEREMIAGLELIEVLPKQPRQRNERRRYRFRAQECAVKAGDAAFFTKAEDPSPESVIGSKLKVEEIDLREGTVVLSSAAFQSGRHPTVIFADPVGPDPEPLENALLALGDQVLEKGFGDAAFPGAVALLLGRTPRPPSAHAALRAPEEPVLDAAKRLSRALAAEALPIQGPPGAGKTYAGARVILDLVQAGKRVGVTAVGHKVIDNLLVNVGKAAARAGATVRLAHKPKDETSAGIEHLKRTDDVVAALGGGAVVGATAFVWADDRCAGTLDYLFIDEAGQMSLAMALAAARAARNVVLLGDPQQLEQPQRGAHPPGADVAALVHLVGTERQTVDESRGLFLPTTYRLHPAICAFTSELYYEARLQPAPGLENQRVGGGTPFAGAGLFLVEVPHEGNQAVAEEEVDAVERCVRSLLVAGTTWTERDGVTRPLAPSDILVVAPYNAQVSALGARLETLGVAKVGTVDRFQGQEAPVVVYSCTSSSPEDAPRGMAFLYDPHRFNVATSRAQGVVIVVASPRLFEPACRTPEQMRWANGLCRYREMACVSRAQGRPAP